MPKAKDIQPGLLDTWGRRNRKHPDKHCPHCGKVFRPLRSSSKYCSRPCKWANNGGHNKKEMTWWINSRGYVEGRIWIGTNRVRVKQHRWIMEQHLGRPLAPHENVHHINGDKTDNRLENLELMFHGSHTSHHSKKRTYKSGYKLNLSMEERQKRSERMKAMRQAETLRKITEGE